MTTLFTDSHRLTIKNALHVALDDGVPPEDVLEECEYVIDNYEDEED